MPYTQTKQQIEQEIAALELQQKDIAKKIATLKLSLSSPQHKTSDSPQPTLSKQEKIKLFTDLFIGRHDVYAKHWVSQDGNKQGYSPATRTFRGTDYIEVSDSIILSHLEGKIRIGTYAIFDETFCGFLAIDLDKDGFIEDARAIKAALDEIGINGYFEISKSGNGIHIWFFFSNQVFAREARKLGDIIISKAMKNSSTLDMKSYDRMFPNQDYVASNGLGNLIALPLHYASRQENKTVFIDIDTLQPIDDQWQLLQDAIKLTPYKLKALLDTYTDYDESQLWSVKKDTPITFPKSISITLFDSVYIEKAGLSKSFILYLKRLSSFSNPEFFKMQALRKPIYNIPRIISCYDINEKYIILPRGLIGNIKSMLDSKGVHYEIQSKVLQKSAKIAKSQLVLSDDQKLGFTAILRNDYALLVAYPGFGKTVVASKVIEKRKVSTLILVNKNLLLDQWQQRLSEYFDIDKKSIGILGKSKNTLTGSLDIASLQSLINKPEIIEQYSQIIVDECHHLPAVTFESVIKRFRGRFVLGLSATPIRKDGMHPIIYMQCGQIAYEAKQNKTTTHRLEIVTTNFTSDFSSFSDVVGELYKDEDRNLSICNKIRGNGDKNILVLTERIEHLAILGEMLEKQNIQFTELHGQQSSKNQRSNFESGKTASLILATSSYFGEGIDFNHLDAIIFTMPISYHGRIVQYLGRIGRRGQKCLAIDFVDDKVSVLNSIYNRRSKAYKQMGYVVESGFGF
jgi:superfamily II DNA or RNA helicase